MSTNFLTNLVHHYELNETAANSAPGGLDFADSVGSAHLTDGGDCLYNQSAPANLGASFDKDGTASHPPRVAFGDLDWNFNTGENFTISFWMYLPSAWSQFERLFSFCSNAQDEGINAKMLASSGSNSKIYFRVNSSSILSGVGTTDPLTASAFNHVVWTYEIGVGSKIYINGSLSDTEGTVTAQPTPITDEGLTLLGQYDSGGSTIQDGRMAQFSLWNKILTAEEVTELYNSGDGLAFSSFQPSNPNPRRKRGRRRRGDARRRRS